MIRTQRPKKTKFDGTKLITRKSLIDKAKARWPDLVPASDTQKDRCDCCGWKNEGFWVHGIEFDEGNNGHQFLCYRCATVFGPEFFNERTSVCRCAD